MQLGARRCVAAVLLLLANEYSSSVLADQLADETAIKNRAAVESIHTLSCRYSKARYDGSGKRIEQYPQVEYWRSGTTFRSLWRRGEQWCDTIVTGLQLQTTSNHVATKTVNGTVASYQGFPSFEGDPCLDTLLMFVGDRKKNPSPLLFADLLCYPGLQVSASRQLSHGKQYVVIELISPGGTSRGEFWFDPAANYLISRRVTTVLRNAKLSVVTTEIERFVEAAPGIFFPVKIRRTDTDDGQLRCQYVSEAKNVRINDPLPPDTFQTGFKPGTKVLDEIQEKKYTVGPDGRSEIDVGDLPIPRPPLGARELTETKSEPKPMSAWLLPVSLAVLAMGGGLWLVRRWRTRSAGS